MARKKTVAYLNHDADSYLADKMVALMDHMADWGDGQEDSVLSRSLAGAGAYGAYWMLCEKIRISDNLGIRMDLYPSLARSFGVPRGFLIELVDKALELDLFQVDGDKSGLLVSERISRDYQKMQDIHDARRRGGLKRWENVNKVSQEEKSKELSTSSPRANAPKRERERERDKKKSIVGQEPDAAKKKPDFEKIIGHLNSLTGAAYRADSRATKDAIKARMNEGYSEQDVLDAISGCYEQKKNDPEQLQYVRPSTIFRASNFENYLQFHKTGPRTGSRKVSPEELDNDMEHLL